MNTKLATSRNFVFRSHPTHTERGGGLSSTTPDQAFSIREILENNSIRASVPVYHSHYTGDIDVPDVKAMDLVEIEQAAGDFALSVKSKKEELNAIKKRKSELQDKLEEEKFEKQFAKRQPKAPDQTADTGSV